VDVLFFDGVEYEFLLFVYGCYFRVCLLFVGFVCLFFVYFVVDVYVWVLLGVYIGNKVWDLVVGLVVCEYGYGGGVVRDVVDVIIVVSVGVIY